MELFIDNNPVDVDCTTALALSLSVASLTDIEYGRSGYTKTIVLPATPHNREIMGDAEQINTVTMFNATPHTARIVQDGNTLFEGTPVLTGCDCSTGGDAYRLNITGASKNWVGKAADNTLASLPSDFEMQITASTIEQSWTWDKPVRFLPVQRDAYAGIYPSKSFQPVARVLTAEDYHPFLSVRAQVNAIFENCGYTVRSAFVDSKLFGSLYMSGNYNVSDVSALKTAMDFKARRYASRSAVADSYGRVYASPYVAYSSVGNIVDVADATASAQGVQYGDTFTNNGCFQYRDVQIAFMPTRRVSVGFFYHIAYRTEYCMLSRNELSGFNQVWLDSTQSHKFRIPNRFTDCKQAPMSNFEYLFIMFGHTEGCSYVLSYKCNDVYVNSERITTRSAKVKFGVADDVIGSIEVLVSQDGGSTYRYTTDDWALYSGYVTERGMTDVVLDLRSAPETRTPTSPKYFDTLTFGGAQQGMTLEVGAECYLRPVFYANPTTGSTVTWNDIAAGATTQLELIAALKQMFNLVLFTDVTTKTVYIEPWDDFYDTDSVVDWTDRLDFSKGFRVESLSYDMAHAVTLCYRNDDGYVRRWNTANNASFGTWSRIIDSSPVKTGTSIYRNPLFTASINVTGGYPDSPSARIMQVGDRDADSDPLSENLNITPRIVHYAGMRALPPNEKWGWPAFAGAYPYVAFHAPDCDFPVSLCFEYRDCVQGLSSRYEHRLMLCDQSRRLTIRVHLDSDTVASISHPQSTECSFRNLYRLNIDGEDALWILESINDYNPGEASPECVFVKYI